MRAALLVVFLLAQARPIPKSPDTSQVTATLVTEKSSFFLGEKIPIRYCITNISQTVFEAGFASSPQRFTPTASDDQGNFAPRNSFTLINPDEISGIYAVKPGERHCEPFELTNYVRFSKPGIYTVATIYEFVTPWIIGNPTRLPKVFGPEARTTLTLLDPAPSDASAVVATMTFDGLSTRPAVYLEPLLDAVRQGKTEAIRVIGLIPTPEATRALMQLLDSSDAAMVRNAAAALAWRVPPAVEGTLGTLGGLGTNLDLREGWRPEFAAELRGKAVKLLRNSGPWVADAGAFILASIGEPEDIPEIAEALNRSMSSRTLADQLTRAAEGIVGRGYKPPPPSTRVADQTIWVVALARGFRPDIWETILKQILETGSSYVQELATRRMPVPAPDSIVSSLGKLVESSHSAIQSNVCRIIVRDSIRGLRPRAMSVFRKTEDEDVFESCGYAVLQLGPPMEYYDIVLSRLRAGEIGAAALNALLNVFADTTGGGGRTTLSASEARSLAPRWRTFINKHRVELEARTKLFLDSPDATADLVPREWSLSRDGKPSWPQR